MTRTISSLSWADPEEGAGGPDPPPENHKNIGFLSNTGPYPLKSHKATKPASMYRAIIGTPAKRRFNWRFAGGAMMAR